MKIQYSFLKDKLILLKSALVFFFFILTLPEVFASTITVPVTSSAEIKGAIGLIISPSGLIKQDVKEIKRVSDNLVLIRFDVEDSLLNNEKTKVSAMVILDKSEVAFADVRSPEYKSILPPLCTTHMEGGLSIEGKQNLILSLIEIRSSRRDVLKEKLTVLLSKHGGLDLEKLESTFGLRSITSIDKESNVYSVLDRLWRLKLALDNYSEAQQ
jgi:hypothetical protein